VPNSADFESVPPQERLVLLSERIHIGWSLTRFYNDDLAPSHWQPLAAGVTELDDAAAKITLPASALSCKSRFRIGSVIYVLCIMIHGYLEDVHADQAGLYIHELLYLDAATIGMKTPELFDWRIRIFKKSLSEPKSGRDLTLSISNEFL